MSDHPDFARALDGLAMVADGLRLVDQNFGALPRDGQAYLDNSGMQYVDALSVDRLRIALRTMKDADHA